LPILRVGHVKRSTAFRVTVGNTECHNAKCCNAECRNAECHYAECHNAKCRNAECRNVECQYAECHYAECHNAACKKGFLLKCLCAIVFPPCWTLEGALLGLALPLPANIRLVWK
jgi:hypothetical protein